MIYCRFNTSSLGAEVSKMEATEGKLNAKLTLLNITTKRTTFISENGHAEAIERHHKTLKTVINEVDQMRIEIEAYKIANKENDEDLNTWNSNIESLVAKADKSAEFLKECLNDRKAEREAHQREEQIKFEVKLQETKSKVKA